VARVPAAANDEGRDIYYMISTTMHLSPGAPIVPAGEVTVAGPRRWTVSLCRRRGARSIRQAPAVDHWVGGGAH
jgi:hypothetical protein